MKVFDYSMPNTVGQVNIDAVLSDQAKRIIPDGFIADIIAPPIMLSTCKAYQRPVWDRSLAFKKTDDNRASATQANEVRVNISWAAGLLQEHALSLVIGRDELEEVYDTGDVEAGFMETLKGLIAINREKRVADILTTLANFDASNYLDLSASKWTTATSAATVAGIIKAGAKAVVAGTGRSPNAMIMPYGVAVVVGEIFADRIKYLSSNQSDLVIVDELGIPKVMFGMRVLIPKAVYSTSEVQGVFTSSTVWGQNVVLCVAPPAAVGAIPAEGAIPIGKLSFETVKTFANRYNRVRKGLEEVSEKQWYEMSDVVEETLFAKESGYLIYNCVA